MSENSKDIYVNIPFPTFREQWQNSMSIPLVAIPCGCIHKYDMRPSAGSERPVQNSEQLFHIVENCDGSCRMPKFIPKSLDDLLEIPK